LDNNCNKGDKCRFAHDEQAREAFQAKKLAKSKVIERTPEKSTKIVCKFFIEGGCTRIDCPFLHEQLPIKSRPKKACTFFQQGKCNKGNECPFSHEDISTTFAKMKM
jgi:hypothetical protein